MLPTILGICLLIIAVIYFRAPRKATPKRKGRASQNQPFAAVEIVPGSTCCARARALSQQPIIAAAAPTLPLAGCTSQCQCKFGKRVADRRRTRRRRTDDGLSDVHIYAGGENRSGFSRRS